MEAAGELRALDTLDASIEAAGELRALDTLDARVEVEVDRCGETHGAARGGRRAVLPPALDAGIDAAGELRALDARVEAAGELRALDTLDTLDALDASIEAGIEALGHYGGEPCCARRSTRSTRSTRASRRKSRRPAIAAEIFPGLSRP